MRTLAPVWRAQAAARRCQAVDCVPRWRRRHAVCGTAVLNDGDGAAPDAAPQSATMATAPRWMQHRVTPQSHQRDDGRCTAVERGSQLG